MTIAHADLTALASLPEQFALIGEYLRGASVQVTFEREGEVRTRTHLITDAPRFRR